MTPSADTQFQGEPFQRGVKYTEGGKFCDFRLEIAFISQTVREAHCCDGTLYCRCMADRSMSVHMTLSQVEWLWKLKGGTQWVIFQEDLFNNIRIVWPSTSKFGRITHVGMGVGLCICQGGHLGPTPLPQGVGAQAQPNFWGFPFWSLLVKRYELT